MQEFLDTEWDNIKPPFQKSHQQYLETPVVRHFAQTTRLKYIQENDQEILSDLKNQIRVKGIKTPLTFKIDNYSKVALYDGHHRLIVAEQLGIYRVPVQFEHCELLRVKSRHVLELIGRLVT